MKTPSGSTAQPYPYPRKQREKVTMDGFTLMEMLVAMLILSTLIASVYSAFHAGILASRRATEADGPGNTMSRMHLMAMEIRNAVYWNNMLIAGTANEIYFYTPMQLKRPEDIVPLYRVRYWYEKTSDEAGMLHRSIVPWIQIQDTEGRADDIARLEKTQQWLGPMEGFAMDYALAKNKEGPLDLVWKESFSARSQIPYGVRLKGTTIQGEKKSPFTTIFWPALGIYQPKPSDIAGIIKPSPSMMGLEDMESTMGPAEEGRR